VTEKEKQKDNILSGFFDKCRENYKKNSKPINYFGLNEEKEITNNKAEDKLKRIKDIIEE